MADIRIRSTEARGDALVDDLAFDGPDGLEVEAYLVRPGEPDATGERAAGLLMWHWLDSEAPDGNRTQYLDEAAGLAAAGAVCLLPQGRFPWSQPPTGSSRRHGRGPRRGGPASSGPGPPCGSRRTWIASRLGVVGHDFGGMIAAVEAADEDRLKALVIVAATPRWGDWFLPFWDIPRGPHRLPARDASDRPDRGHRPGDARRPSCSSSVDPTSSSPR